MPAVALMPNSKLYLNGSLHQVVGRVRHDSVHLEHRESREIIQLTLPKLMKKIHEGKATILHIRHNDSKVKKRLKKRLQEQIDALPEKTKAAFERKYAYVKAIWDYMPIPKSKARILPIIKQVASDIDDNDPPSFSTVCRWLSAFKAGSQDPRALIPSDKDKGNRNRRLCPEVLEILQKGIEERYLNVCQGSPLDVSDYVVRRIHEENEFRMRDEQLELPDMRSIYREIEKMDAYTKDEARYGKEAAERRNTVHQNAPKATRPLERVEIDHTVLDFFLVDERTGLLIGRPTLTVAVDSYTRMIVGFYIGFEPPGWQAVMHCLYHAILHKDSLRGLFKSINNEWSAYGVMDTIVVDNGREFHSTDFELACAALGIEILYTPRAKPWFKGAVERTFGTINSRLLRGKRGSVVRELIPEDDYKPYRDAVASIKDLTEAFCKWVVDVYSQEDHSGIDEKPAVKWQQAMEECPRVRIPTSVSDFAILMSSTEDRTIQRYGIELNGIKYRSTELSDLRQKLKRGKNPHVDVKFKPSDLGSIHVKDPIDGGFIEVPAEDLGYAKGLNLWQQKMIMRWRRKRRNQNRVDIDLVQAREEIRQIFERSQQFGLKLKHAKRRARANGVSSTSVLEQNQHPPTDPKQVPAATDAEIEEWAEDYHDIEEEDSDDWGIETNDSYPE